MSIEFHSYEYVCHWLSQYEIYIENIYLSFCLLNAICVYSRLYSVHIKSSHYSYCITSSDDAPLSISSSGISASTGVSNTKILSESMKAVL